MTRTILSYGAVAGLIMGVPLFAMTVLHGGPPMGASGMVVGYLIMLVALSMIFLAIKRERDGAGGGVIRFWPALGLGFSISLVAGIFYVVAWEAALAVTGTDFGAVYAKMMVEEQRAAGVKGAALARYAAEMEQFRRDYARPLYRMPMTFLEITPVALLVSLVSAGLLSNSRFLPARRS